MDIAHQIALRLGTLPTDKLQEVLDFIEFLRGRVRADEANDAQPFRGMPVLYVEPTEPVAAEDWEAAH
jgi:hypothetical protein